MIGSWCLKLTLSKLVLVAQSVLNVNRQTKKVLNRNPNLKLNLNLKFEMKIVW